MTISFPATTYLTAAAVAQLDNAQRLLDAHVVVLGTGACRLCGTLDSCDYRAAASATFARYRRLPRRRPGASRPEPAESGHGTPIRNREAPVVAPWLA